MVTAWFKLVTSRTVEYTCIRNTNGIKISPAAPARYLCIGPMMIPAPFTSAHSGAAHSRTAHSRTAKHLQHIIQEKAMDQIQGAVLHASGSADLLERA